MVSLVWCSISGHGFGHAAQLVPILNELGRRHSHLRFFLRTTTPAAFFQETLTVPWEWSYSQQDIGCIQRGPLSIDVEQTWNAYTQFHDGWKGRVMDEVHAMRKAKPVLVLSNISHLGIAAGVEAGYPAVAFGSLSWDQVLAQYLVPGCLEHETIVAHIRQAYHGVSMMIRPYPGIPMVAFPEVYDVGPVLLPFVEPEPSIRQTLKMDSHERLVLIAFGGIPLSTLPLEQIDALEGYRFLVSGALDCRNYKRIGSTEKVGLSFRRILAESDVVMTKPGYATTVETVRLGKPMVYVRRHNFADEQPLVDFAHRYGRAQELSLNEFESGQWANALGRVQSILPPKESMPPEGTGETVEHLLKFLK
ncbi:MAG: hypothetical protein NPIRA05_06840 [Nitrospirales bacterium]|nr:MAG: hypothetical protein NPIRA05_06840 [Nitrospirales bacterium]